jgi:hypothetical protein
MLLDLDGSDQDAIRGAMRHGSPLDVGLRHVLEANYRVDLSAIRVHTGKRADRLTHLLKTDAFASGPHLFFRAGAYQPASENGMRLLAHEIAHSIQQAHGAQPHHVLEEQAEWAAERVVSGRPAHIGGQREVVRPVGVDAPVIVQRHESFEHRALGDLSTGDIVSLTRPKQRADVVERETQLMWLWHQSPELVTEADISKLCPWIRTIRLQPHKLLVTYGELNALPDYVPNAAAIETLPKHVLLSLLQTIRQESYQRLNRLRGKETNDRFFPTEFDPGTGGLLDKLFQSWGLDSLTFTIGKGGMDHYMGLLARNACHFAPFTWHRWQASYLMARGFAERAHDTKDSTEKERLTRLAWIYHGYADHFLQDSFAAGHLVNKTLVMQWYVEWARNSNLYVEDWDLIKDMTFQDQPNIWGGPLYHLLSNGPSNDPQTVEELPTLDQRRKASLIKGDANAYQRYLTFLSSVIAQAASNAVHDEFNKAAVWVASPSDQDPYQVYGDDTLFREEGTLGAQHTSEAAHLSQRSIRELLRTGETTIDAQALRWMFPSRAGASKDNLKSLDVWARNQKDLAFGVFNSGEFLGKRVLTQTYPRILNFSQDQEFSNKWYTGLMGGGEKFSGRGYGYVDVVTLGNRLFAGSQGYVYELDSSNGQEIRRLKVADGLPETHVATDGKMLFAGCDGRVYASHLNSWDRVVWSTRLPGRNTHLVHVLAAHGKLFAGTNGYLAELDPTSGRMLNEIKVSDASGWEVRLATDGKMLFSGCHGFAYGTRLNDWREPPAWTAAMPGSGYHNVQLLYTGGALYAGSNGTALQLDPGTGRRLREQSLTRASGTEVRLATDGKTLAAGCNGYVTGFRLNTNWAGAAWSTPLSGKLWTEVGVASSNGHVYAVSNGYVHRLDMSTGAVKNAMNLSFWGDLTGDYTPQVVIDGGQKLFVGMHGYAYGMV